MSLSSLLRRAGLLGLLVMAYLMMAGSLDVIELAVGAIAALGVFLLALALGPEFSSPLRIRPMWFRLLVSIPWAMIMETGLLASALMRRLSGRDAGGTFIEFHFPKGTDEHEPARQTWIAWGICITPNSYLVHHDCHTGQMILRQLQGKKLSRLDRQFLELR